MTAGAGPGALVLEEALVFSCAGEQLVGVLTRPASAARVCVMVVVGGPQYRAGSHRSFVQLARSLAAEGVAVFRFDVRGMGDSTGDWRGFEALDEDIDAAFGAVQRQRPEIDRWVLWGLCDGASAALMHLQSRPKRPIHGLCLVNPWVRSEASQARTQVKHYYLERLRQLEFWRKVLRGGVAVSAISGLWRNARLAFSGRQPCVEPAAAASFQDRMAAAWAGFDGPLLLVLSGNDYTAKEFVEYTAANPRWRGLLSRPRVTRCELPDADHTLSSPADKAMHAAALSRWLGALQ